MIYREEKGEHDIKRKRERERERERGGVVRYSHLSLNIKLSQNCPKFTDKLSPIFVRIMKYCHCCCHNLAASNKYLI